MEEAYPDRIISSKELEELKELLISQNLDYPNYEDWVNDTLSQVKKGEKIAFGIFTDKLEADGVIRITASDTVELKNFFIREPSRDKGYGSMLLDYIERFCIERGCTQVQVDSFVNNKNLAGFLINKDYQFSARGDFYGIGKESYLMIKTLPLRYIGDYDWFAISNWVMKIIFGYRLEDKTREKELQIYIKEEKDITKYASVLFYQDLDRALEVDALESFFGTKGCKGLLFCFAPHFSIESIAYADKKGIILIDRNKLQGLSHISLPTSSEDIVGLIVPVKPEYYAKLMETNDRVFIKGGNTPSGIEEDQIMLFYVTSPDMCIKGYTTIQNIANADPEHIWSKHSTQSVFSEGEYKTYTEGKTSVTAFSFNEIKNLTEYINLDTIRDKLGSFNHQAGQRITAEDWQKIKHLKKEKPMIM